MTVVGADLDLAPWADTPQADTLQADTPPIHEAPPAGAHLGTALMVAAAAPDQPHGAGLAALCPHQGGDIPPALLVGQLQGDWMAQPQNSGSSMICFFGFVNAELGGFSFCDLYSYEVTGCQ